MFSDVKVTLDPSRAVVRVVFYDHQECVRAQAEMDAVLAERTADTFLSCGSILFTDVVTACPKLFSVETPDPHVAAALKKAAAVLRQLRAAEGKPQANGTSRSGGSGMLGS